MYALEKYVPIPTVNKKSNEFPLKDMSIGDSFFVPDSEVSRNRIAAACSNFAKRTGGGFTIRKVEGGYRVWRYK